jgi:Family of unknown function (DUF5686)/CarboxypepD_reg-like domain
MFLFYNTSFEQVTKIMGQVTDSVTKEALPFVNIIVKRTTEGTLTDFDGKYSFELKEHGDSIRFSLMGYNSVTRYIFRNQFQIIDVEMSSTSINLPEVVIHYTGNPAEAILAKIIKNREKNSMQDFQTYQYKAYTKIEFDANNITEKLRNRKLFKPFGFISQFIDTSTVNGKSFLPVFITETSSDVFFRKSPKAKKEIITASRVSGLENLSIAQFLGNLSQEVDIYKDYIPLFEKNFVSPIASFGPAYYKYYLVDSTFFGNKWCYRIMFKPRRKQELTFTGNFWVNDTTWAIRKVEMHMVNDANINFINDMNIRQEYQWTENKFWMKTRDYLVIDFNIVMNTQKTIGFFGHRTTVYSDFQFDMPESRRFMSIPTNVIELPQSENKTEKEWDTIRPEKLSQTESGIYKMVDTMKTIPILKTYIDVIYGITTGYLSWGKFELGQYFKLYSFNDVEGNRFRLGLRTANSFSKKMQLEGYLAYGTKDQTFKYGGDFIYMFSKNPRRDLSVFFKWDVEQLGKSQYALASDNILTSIFHRGPNNKLTMVREFKVAYEHEWFNGLINTIQFLHREVFPLGSTEFMVYPGPEVLAQPMKSIYTSEIRLDTRFSFREKFVSGQIYRYSISSNYPIILLSYSYGIPRLFNSDYEYHKLNLGISQWFNFATIGWSNYIIEAGKIWGRLPYPLLKIHEGNQTFLFDEYASNLMNYYEFTSDQFVSLSFSHHFDGLLFNKIPLLRKLKWREVLQARGVYGSLSAKNQDYSEFPDQLRSFGKEPYLEAGAGIENILRFIRVDAIWRLTHLNDSQNLNVPKFGVFVSLNFTF